MSDRPVRITDEERTQILDNYDKGPDEGEQIDECEDPAYKVGHITDCYGARLWRCCLLLNNDEYSSFDNNKANEVEMERAQKWLTMNWDKYNNGTKVDSQTYKGIPEKLRGHIWGLMLDVKREVEEHSGVYKEMKKQARRWSPDIKQIDNDVNRTYRNHSMFRKRYDVKQQALFHVLAAYSMYNPEIGYCQGMSQIAALLLMYLDEEDAFWALSVLISDTKHALHGFFIEGFPKLRRYQEHHNRILAKFLPKVRDHFEKTEMPADLYTPNWHMQCFIDQVPFRLLLRLWDIYVLEGDRLLVAMSYNVLKMHQKKILKMSLEELRDFFKVGLQKEFSYGENQVVESLQKCMVDLRRCGLDLPPPPVDDREKPSKPFGVFVPPSIVGADGDSIHSSAKIRQSSSSSAASLNVLDDYETATDGSSLHNGQISSKTSLVDEIFEILEPMWSENMEYEAAYTSLVSELDTQRNEPWNGSNNTLPKPESVLDDHETATDGSSSHLPRLVISVPNGQNSSKTSLVDEIFEILEPMWSENMEYEAAYTSLVSELDTQRNEPWNGSNNTLPKPESADSFTHMPFSFDINGKAGESKIIENEDSNRYRRHVSNLVSLNRTGSCESFSESVYHNDDTHDRSWKLQTVN